jgi:hypothetical protein
MLNNDFIIHDFWTVEMNQDNQEVVTISMSEFLTFLEINGFGKIYMDGEKVKPTFIRIQRNIARIASRDTIITFGRSYVRNRIHNRDTRGKIYNAFFKSVVSKPETIYSMFKVKSIEFISDARDIIYFCFRNNIIAATKDSLVEIDYDDAPGVIWEDQIIDKDISINQESDYVLTAEFNRFLLNISEASSTEQAQKRYRSILSVTGYLIHEFRDLSKMKAIILMDANLSDVPEGGAGKGLYIQGIRQIRQTVIEDGKNFTFNSRFLFQQVKPSTRILFFDDVTKKFDFEKLFSTITDGITVEQKYRDRFIIPAEKSPRIVASTNYVILGKGGSFERRKFEFEFSSHYNKDHSPYDEFKHIFFSEWSDEEWNKFFNFMIYACQFYLSSGLVEAPSINIAVKTLIHSTAPEFYEFMQDAIRLDVEYNKKDLFLSFLSQFPDFNHLKQRTFTNWLGIYADLRNLIITERKSGDNYFVTFSTQYVLMSPV